MTSVNYHFLLRKDELPEVFLLLPELDNFLPPEPDFAEEYDPPLLEEGDLEEWVIFLSLNASDENLKLKECNFDLYMRTYRNEPSENITGIHATRTLKSDITSGTW